ncbi:unnamed protein product, partial [Prorocentrum cordatum]
MATGSSAAGHGAAREAPAAPAWGAPGRAIAALAAASGPPRPRWADYSSDDEGSCADWGEGGEALGAPRVPRGSVGGSSASTEAVDDEGGESEQGGQPGRGTPAGGCALAEAVPLVNLVLRNLPSRAGSEAIVGALGDFGYGGRFEYFYIPCKPRDGMNRGYAFAGFEDAHQAGLFRAAVHGRRLPGRNSSKALSVDVADSHIGGSQNKKAPRGEAEPRTLPRGGADAVGSDPGEPGRHPALGGAVGGARARAVARPRRAGSGRPPRSSCAGGP